MRKLSFKVTHSDLQLLKMYILNLNGMNYHG